MLPWRNWLARSAVNRKVGGSSPPGSDSRILRITSGLLAPVKVVCIQLQNGVAQSDSLHVPCVQWQVTSW